MKPFFGHKFGPQLEVYYLIVVWCFFCVLAMYALTQTPFGRMCNAVRENPERVEFVRFRGEEIAGLKPELWRKVGDDGVI